MNASTAGPAPPAADPVAAAADYARLDSIHLAPAQAQALLRLVETAPEIHRRYQFFVWMQSHLQVLLPHVLAVCGAYQRQRRHLVFETFHTVALPPAALEMLAGTEPPLMSAAARLWAQGGGRPLALTLTDDRLALPAEPLALLRRAGLRHALVHGVARPDRPHEIETLFLLADTRREAQTQGAQLFELLVQPLHATYLRTRSVERDVAPAAPRMPTPAAPRTAPRVTPREVQILHWVREGKSNHEVGLLLGISALTVKNHVQKILRKLGASNRAHAVALAMQAQLLGDDAAERGEAS